MLFLIIQLDNFRGDLSDMSVKPNHCWSQSIVLPFSKVNKTFLGHLDPENTFLDDENK